MSEDNEYNHPDKENELYVHLDTQHYANRHSEEYGYFSNYLEKVKINIYKSQLKTVKKRRMMDVGGDLSILSLYDDIIGIYQEDTSDQAFQSFVDGKLKLFNFGDKIISVEDINRQIRSDAKKEQIEIDVLINNIKNFMKQLDERMKTIEDILAEHAPDVHELMLQDAAYNNKKNAKYNNVYHWYVENFLNNADEGVVKSKQSSDSPVHRLSQNISKIDSLINTLEYNGGIEHDKTVFFKPNSTGIGIHMTEILSRIGQMMGSVIGDLGEIAALYGLRKIEIQFVSALEKAGLTNTTYKAGIVGQASYDKFGNLIQLTTTSKMIADQDFEKFISNTKKDENDKLTRSKTDVMVAVTDDKVILYFPFSVKNYTRQFWNNSGADLEVSLQKFKFKDRLEEVGLWHNTAFKRYAYNMYGGRSFGNQYKKGFEREKNIQDIVDYVGASSLLNAIVGSSGEKTQNIIGVIVNGKLYPITEIYNQLINSLSPDDINQRKIGIIYNAPGDLKRSHSVNKIETSDELKTDKDAALERSKQAQEKVNELISSKKLTIKLKLLSIY